MRVWNISTFGSMCLVLNMYVRASELNGFVTKQCPRQLVSSSLLDTYSFRYIAATLCSTNTLACVPSAPVKHDRTSVSLFCRQNIIVVPVQCWAGV
jgi:hypothetical protein